MHTLSGRAVVTPMVTALLLWSWPLAHRVDANEFPSQPAPQRQSPYVQPLRKSDAMVNRTRAADTRVLLTPDVVGQRIGDAKGKLEGAGLRAGSEVAEATRAARPGTVVRQSPAAGTPIKPGAVISLWVAAAPPRDDRRPDDVGSPIEERRPPRGDIGIKLPDGLQFVVVPDLGRRSLPEAVSILERARLRLGSQRREESDAAPDSIIGQVPPAGQRVLIGTPVSIVMATPVLVEVPDILGRPLAEAVEQLQRHRLGLGAQQREESEAVAGAVVSQTPAAGRRVPVGSSIAIAVATPMLVTVPDVRGASEAEAVAQLQGSRLRTGDRSRQESDDTVGTIVNQRPAPGTRVSPGTPVSLSVAVPMLVSVPDLSGRTDDEARQLLRERQLVLGDRQRQESDARPGSITRQSPRADTRVARGTRIDVVVAIAPAITPVALPPSPPPPQRPAVTQPSSQKPSVIDRGRTPTPPEPPTRVSPASPAPPAPPTMVSPRLTREDPAPVASATSVVLPTTRPPVRRFDWLYPFALGAALVLVVGGARTAFRRYSGRRTSSPRSAPVPALDFASHWDAGTMRIGPAGALCAGSGLRLVSGIDMDSAHLDNDHIVGVVNVAGESR
jgi:beta-lactam-binding protein with PASTA domain